jgi:hypothetical protein
MLLIRRVLEHEAAAGTSSKPTKEQLPPLPS